MHPSTPTNPLKLHHANAINSPISINELHHFVSHLNFQTLQEVISKGVITGISLDKSTSDFCLVCIQGKAHHQAFPKESQTTYATYSEKVIVDLWGPAQVNLLGGNHYYQLYHDMYTHEDHVDLLKVKFEAFGRY